MTKKVIVMLIVVTLGIGTVVGCGKQPQENNVGTSQTEDISQIEDTYQNEDISLTEDISKTLDTEVSSVEDDYIPSWDGMDPGYDVNPDYDKFAMTEYNWKEPSECVIVLVSAMKDNSKFECHFTLSNEEQLAVVTYDGNTYSVESDMTGKVSKEVIEICKNLVDAGEWVDISLLGR